MPTHEQRMASLAMANVVRTGNRMLCEDIRKLGRREARTRVADLLAHFHNEGQPLASMPVRRLLNAVPSFGEAKIWRFLVTANVFSGDKRVGQLSVAQRTELAVLLREMGER